MSSEVFQKEASTLELAQEALAKSKGMDERSDKAFSSLVKGYGRLLRQSRRMVTMGDRIQQALNDLNNEIAASEAKYRGVFENVNEGIFRCSPSGAIIEVNPALARMLGFADGNAFLDTIMNMKELFCSLSDFDRFLKMLGSEGIHREEVQVCRPDGVKIWVEMSACVIRDEADESCTGMVGVLADVTERKQMLEEMCRLARTDSLTGLYNRGYFMELAERDMARSLRNGGNLSLLILDVDYFKAVNDTYGHDVGDHTLIQISEVIRSSVREIDIVGRYGGEEFVVLLPDAAVDAAVEVAERICGKLRANELVSGLARLTATVSVGLTSLEQDDDLDSLLKFADIALYAAKKKGRDRVEIYRRESHSCSGCPSLGTQEAIQGEHQ